ncbi:MAG: UrcA family protein [Allosphingosinicella sp.]
MNRIRNISLALIACAAFATPAAASPEQIPVSYADLDLTTPAGIATLDARLERAVRQVCGGTFPMSLDSRAQVRRCQAETRADIQPSRGEALAQAQSRGTQMASRGR